MSRRRGRAKTAAKSQRTEAHHGAQLILLLGLVMIMFYLWGRVQIDTVLRETGKLEGRKTALLREIDALRVEVNTQKSYAHIAAQAKARGMEVVPAVRRAELAVDLGDVYPVQAPEPKLRVAGMGLLELKSF